MFCYMPSEPLEVEIEVTGARNDNFWKISVRTIWDVEFSEHLLLNFLFARLSYDFRTPQKWYNCPFLTNVYPKKVT